METSEKISQQQWRPRKPHSHPEGLLFLDLILYLRLKLYS